MSQYTTTFDTTSSPLIKGMYKDNGYIDTPAWIDGLKSLDLAELAPLSAGTMPISKVGGGCSLLGTPLLCLQAEGALPHVRACVSPCQR